MDSLPLVDANMISFVKIILSICITAWVDNKDQQGFLYISLFELAAICHGVNTSHFHTYVIKSLSLQKMTLPDK